MDRLRHAVAPVRDVFPDRRIEQERLLRHHPEQAPVGCLRQSPEVEAVDRDRSAVRIVQPEDQVGEGRLAGAAGADERRDLALRDLEAHAAQHRLALVGEGHVFDDDAIAKRRDGLWSILHSRPQDEQLGDPARGGQRRLHRRVRGAQKAELHHRRASDVQEQEEGGNRQVAGEQLPGR